jgi:hypothetical protein
MGSPIIAALAAVLSPNSMWIVKRAEKLLTDNRRLAIGGAGLLAGVAGFVGLIFIGAHNEFLYFQF